MLNYKVIDYSNRLKINLNLVNKSISKIQKCIYLATKDYHTSLVHKYQRKLLCLKKEVLLIVLYKLIKKIKKKYICVGPTTKNFFHFFFLLY